MCTPHFTNLPIVGKWKSTTSSMHEVTIPANAQVTTDCGTHVHASMYVTELSFCIFPWEQIISAVVSALSGAAELPWRED